MTNSDIEKLFSEYVPKGDQAERFEVIRNAGKDLATAIMIHTPSSADQAAAIRKVREAVMTANAAIACNE